MELLNSLILADTEFSVQRNCGTPAVFGVNGCNFHGNRWLSGANWKEIVFFVAKFWKLLHLSGLLDFR